MVYTANSALNQSVMVPSNQRGKLIAVCPTDSNKCKFVVLTTTDKISPKWQKFGLFSEGLHIMYSHGQVQSLYCYVSFSPFSTHSVRGTVGKTVISAGMVQWGGYSLAVKVTSNYCLPGQANQVSFLITSFYDPQPGISLRSILQPRVCIKISKHQWNLAIVLCMLSELHVCQKNSIIVLLFDILSSTSTFDAFPVSNAVVTCEIKLF